LQSKKKDILLKKCTSNLPDKLPGAPLLLALILGPMAEENFRRSLILSEGNYATFLTHPICATILTLAALSLVYGAWRSRRGRAGIGVLSDSRN